MSGFVTLKRRCPLLLQLGRASTACYCENQSHDCLWKNTTPGAEFQNRSLVNGVLSNIFSLRNESNTILMKGNTTVSSWQYVPLLGDQARLAGGRVASQGRRFQLISLALFLSRCAICICLLSVPSYFGPIHDLMCLLLFLNIFLCPSVPQKSITMPLSCGREACADYFF